MNKKLITAISAFAVSSMLAVEAAAAPIAQLAATPRTSDAVSISAIAILAAAATYIGTTISRRKK